MYKWRIIISGSIVLIISYSSRTAIFYWRTKRSSDKCVRRWQSEASKLTSLTDRLSSSAFLPRMVKLSFVLSRFYCDLLNPNRSRIKKKRKERQNRENYHGELCLNKSHEGKEPKSIWLQIWEISNWYFFAINYLFWSRRASENLWGQQFRVSKYLWQDFSLSLLFLVQMRLPLVAALEFSFPCYRLINWKYTAIFCLKRSAVLCN